MPQSKLLAIGGVPATGKTTLMRHFMSQFPVWRPAEMFPKVHGHYNRANDLYVLGKYAEGDMFAGTDKLSMAVQPKMLRYLKVVRGVKIVFEGDRLFTKSFLDEVAADEGIDLRVMVLKVPDQTVHERHISRGDTQSEKFIKGRETKVKNILNSSLPCHTLSHSTEDETKAAALVMKTWLLS